MERDETEALVNRFLAVCDEANHSRPGSREALQEIMRERPELCALLVERHGDYSKRAVDALLQYASGGNVLVDEATRAWLTELQDTLAEPDDTALESLLVHRVVLCWLAVNAAERLRSENWKEGISTQAADFWDRHVSRLNTDFLKAVRGLATVRKLRRPVAQVNVAGQQVNVMRP